MIEQWKDIKDYELIYEASNTGKIRTCKNKITFTERHGVRKWKQRELKHKKCKGNCCRVTLWKGGKSKDFLVHRLIANAFLDMPLNSELTVDHIDGNRLNNNLSNLRVVTLRENIQLGFNEQGLYKNAQKAIVVKQKGKEMKFISHAECERKLGLYKGCLNSKIKKNKKTFVYKDEEYEIIG